MYVRARTLQSSSALFEGFFTSCSCKDLRDRNACLRSRFAFCWFESSASNDICTELEGEYFVRVPKLGSAHLEVVLYDMSLRSRLQFPVWVWYWREYRSFYSHFPSELVYQVLNGFQAMQGFLRVFGIPSTNGQFVIGVCDFQVAVTWHHFGLTPHLNADNISTTYNKSPSSWPHYCFCSGWSVCEVFWTPSRVFRGFYHCFNWNYDSNPRYLKGTSLSGTTPSGFVQSCFCYYCILTITIMF